MYRNRYILDCMPLVGENRGTWVWEDGAETLGVLGRRARQGPSGAGRAGVVSLSRGCGGRIRRRRRRRCRGGLPACSRGLGRAAAPPHPPRGAGRARS